MTDNVQQFLNRVAEDHSFRERLEAATTQEEKSAILRSEGFGEVHKADVEAFMREQGSAELSDAELEAVAGGESASWAAVIIAAVALALM
jgi:predicted ribosomally synthesized peptide with nif11-like leader